MRLLLLLVVAYATLPTLATSAQADDLAMQQRSLSRHSAATLLLNESAPIANRASPEAQRAGMLAGQEREARQLYAQLFEALQLSYQQADEITRLLAERTMLTSSWSTGAVEHAALPEDHQLVREGMSRIEAILGREGFAQLREYEKTLVERSYLRKLATLLGTVGHPLTSEQTTQLVSIVAAERYRLDPGLRNAPRDTLEHAEEIVRSFDDFDRYVAQLFESVLSLDQREFAAKHFSDRVQRRRAALDSYRKSLAEEDSSYGFLFPAD
jgi:hypothetical protein